MMTEHIAYLLLGTNLGNRTENLSKATAAIRMFIGRVDAQSHVFETEPWGKPHQPLFYNQAVKIATPCSPLETLHLIKQVEFLLGRDNAEKWAPRVIDIDILFFDQFAIESPVLTIPHAHIAQRKFTLEPLRAGFDVGTWEPDVRPEFLRLVKRGTNRSADGDFALAA